MRILVCLHRLHFISRKAYEENKQEINQNTFQDEVMPHSDPPCNDSSSLLYASQYVCTQASLRDSRNEQPLSLLFFFLSSFSWRYQNTRKTKILEIVYNNLRGMLKYQDAPEIFQQI